MQSRAFELEVCVDRLDHALLAAQAGATRIEFNQALALDGLTPSPEQCRYLVRHCPVPIIAMLRPHADGFVYTAAEQSCLRSDCQVLLDAGVAGIAFGALNIEGQLDVEQISRIARLCDGREFVLHRVFDTIENQVEQIPDLIEVGVRRILTSGGAETAGEGTVRLKTLSRIAGDALEILPGSGVQVSVLPKLIKETGCNQFHGSFRLGGSEPDYNEIRRARELLTKTFGA